MRAGERIRFWLVTWFGLGLSPVAPGTVGTLGGVFVAVCLHALSQPAWLVPILWGSSALLLVVGCSMSAFSAQKAWTFPATIFSTMCAGLPSSRATSPAILLTLSI